MRDVLSCGNQITLSSTESEYTGLPYALRDAIPIMELLKELKKKKVPVRLTIPNGDGHGAQVATSNQAPERQVASLHGLRHPKGDLDPPD
jgi:hypothetical protein